MTSPSDTAGIERLQALMGDDYRLQWIIGHGGMSTVWLADDVRNSREVAIKVLRPEFSDNEEFLSRFRNEAEAAKTIVSDNVVKTFDYREIPDPAGHTFCAIVMEYVRGESLADLLARRGSLDEAMALDVLEQAAHGLSMIHRQQLVHRDIKPGNLLITQAGQVKITDFGIAKAAEAVPLTRTGMVVGTAQYVSPEQAQGRQVTAASDVYSLAVVGYEILSGNRPFGGDSSVSVAIAHINQAPPALPTTISAQARELIGIGLRKDPSLRFADGNEFSLAVSAVRMGQRPPQPRSAMLNQQAPEPTPTEVTRQLGRVTHPTTNTPAYGRQQQPPAPHAPVMRAPVAPPKKKSGVGGLLAIVLLLTAAVVGLAAFIFLQPTGGHEVPQAPSSTASISTAPSTSWVTETAPAQQPTMTRAPQTTQDQEEPPVTSQQQPPRRRTKSPVPSYTTQYPNPTTQPELPTADHTYPPAPVPTHSHGNGNGNGNGSREQGGSN